MSPERAPDPAPSPAPFPIPSQGSASRQGGNGGLRLGRLALTVAACLGALVAALAVAPVPAQADDAPAPLELQVTAHDDGAQFWFEVAGHGGRNPDIRVEPGQLVRIHLSNNGTVQHNFAVEGGGVACCVPAGHKAGVTPEGEFTAPAHDAQLAYWCEPHRSLGMEGHIVVGAGSPRAAPGGALAGVLAALAAAALVARSRPCPDPSPAQT